MSSSSSSSIIPASNSKVASLSLSSPVSVSRNTALLLKTWSANAKPCVWNSDITLGEQAVHLLNAWNKNGKVDIMNYSIANSNPLDSKAQQNPLILKAVLYKLSCLRF